MLRFVVSACLALALVSCANLTPRDQKKFKVDPADYGIIAHEVLKQLSHTREIAVIAVPKDMNPDAREALKREKRRIVPLESLHSIPRDTLAMRDFSIDEDGIATFEGEISTDAQDAMKEKSECGMVFAVRFQLVGNDWHSDSYKLTDCTQQRVWWPVDQPQPNQ